MGAPAGDGRSSGGAAQTTAAPPWVPLSIFGHPLSPVKTLREQPLRAAAPQRPSAAELPPVAPVQFAPECDPFHNSLMHQEPMGNTGESVSDVILGTYKAGGTDAWGAANDYDTIETIKYCVDQGVDLIDTATGYGMGRAERLVAHALHDDDAARVDKTRVMTKWYLWQDVDEEKIRSVSPAMQAKSLVGSKARLRSETLDMVLLHRDDEVTPIETAIGTLAEYQSRGDVRHIGASNYSLEHLERAQKTAPLQMYQPGFSLLNTRFRDDGRLAFCREHNIAVGVYGVLGKGWFAPRLKEAHEYPSWDGRRQSHTGPEFEKRKRMHAELAKVGERFGLSVAQLAIAWVLSHEGVTCAIVGASTPAQAEHNLAASGQRLPPETLEECERIVRDAG